MEKALQNKWVLLITLAITWGSVFILIKKSLLVFDPYEIGAVRMVISGIVLVKFALPALRKMSKNTLFWVAVAGFFGNFFPTFLFPMAQTHVSSAMAGILNVLVPIFVLLFGFLFFGIKSRTIQVVGAVFGFLGAAMLVYFSGTTNEGTQFWYALLIVLATACFGLSALIVKYKLDHVPSLQLSSSAITLWMVPSFIALLFTNFFKGFESNSETWEAMGYLIILAIWSTAICGVLYYKLIQKASPIFASTVTYLSPAVAVFWGLVDGEKFTIWYLVGGVLILISIYLIREQNKKPQPLPN